MTEKEFDEGFKLLKRFLKDKGIYKPIMDFLFHDGRMPKHLFWEFNSARFNGVDDWKKVFICTNLMVGKGTNGYDKTDFYHNLDMKAYEELITKPHLHTLWAYYYKDNTDKKN